METIDFSIEHNPIVVGVVAHVDPLFLKDFEKIIRRLDFVKVIFIKQSNGKLWLVEEETGGKAHASDL